MQELQHFFPLVISNIVEKLLIPCNHPDCQEHLNGVSCCKEEIYCNYCQCQFGDSPWGKINPNYFSGPCYCTRLICTQNFKCHGCHEIVCYMCLQMCKTCQVNYCFNCLPKFNGNEESYYTEAGKLKPICQSCESEKVEKCITCHNESLVSCFKRCSGCDKQICSQCWLVCDLDRYCLSLTCKDCAVICPNCNNPACSECIYIPTPLCNTCKKPGCCCLVKCDNHCGLERLCKDCIIYCDIHKRNNCSKCAGSCCTKRQKT
jgi:hypothetical protein